MAKFFNLEEADLLLDDFQARLIKAARNAFQFAQKEHQDESYYAFALYHSPLWGYVIPTCNTEEGLIRVAQEYKLDKHNLGYAQQSIENLARESRWIPCDWAYHGTHKEYFEPVNEWLDEYDIYDLSAKIEDEEIYDDIYNQIMKICRNVLKWLDNDGVFGTGADREKITLNIMMGDQDDTWIGHARFLNPPAVFERWQKEIKDAGLW